MVVVELHPRHARLLGRTHAETAHAATIEVQGTDREEEEEKAVVGLCRVGDMARVVAVIVDFVKGGWVEDREGSMCVLAV